MKKIMITLLFAVSIAACYAQSDSVTVYFSRADLFKKTPVHIFIDGKAVTTISSLTEYTIIKVSPGKHAYSAQIGKFDEAEIKQTIARRQVLDVPGGETIYLKTKQDGSVLEFVEMSKYGWASFSVNLLKSKN